MKAISGQMIAALILGATGAVLLLAGEIGGIERPPGPEYRWSLEDGLRFEARFVEVREDDLILDPGDGRELELPLELLVPMDRYHALKWEQERNVFPEFIGLRLAGLILPKDGVPLDEAIRSVWEEARKVRPELREEPPEVTILGVRSPPVVRATIRGELDAIYAINLLCEQVGFQWAYDEGTIVAGTPSAMERIQAFLEKESFLKKHDEILHPLGDELGINVQFEIRIGRQ